VKAIMRTRTMGFTLLFLSTTGLAFSACGTGGQTNGSGGIDAGAEIDGGCPGICAKRPPSSDGPYLFSSGDAGQVAPCPYDAPGEAAWRGHADLVVPAACEPCVCGPSSGACELPSKLTASTSTCGGGGQPIPFDAPAGWDGACDNTNPIDAGKVYSFVISPMTVTQESCSAVDPGGPVKTSWKKDAVACHGRGWSPCSDSDAVCIPTVDPGFRVCVLIKGDEPCPSSDEYGYTERQVFYTGIDDQRQCTKCACGPPKGSLCKAHVAVYRNSDTTCSGPTVYQSIGIASTTPTCADVNPPGQPLGSKSADSPIYVPGTCDPIPSVVDPDGGTAAQSGPVTICCRP
jgi:hypothetical protein